MRGHVKLVMALRDVARSLSMIDVVWLEQYVEELQVSENWASGWSKNNQLVIASALLEARQAIADRERNATYLQT